MVVLVPVWVAALPEDGVEPVELPPAVVLDELPVLADAEEPVDPDECVEVELLVVVVALAEPPEPPEVGVAVVVGDGVGLGVGDGVGVGVCVVEAGPVHQPG